MQLRQNRHIVIHLAVSRARRRSIVMVRRHIGILSSASKARWRPIVMAKPRVETHKGVFKDLSNRIVYYSSDKTTIAIYEIFLHNH